MARGAPHPHPRAARRAIEKRSTRSRRTYSREAKRTDGCRPPSRRLRRHPRDLKTRNRRRAHPCHGRTTREAGVERRRAAMTCVRDGVPQRVISSPPGRGTRRLLRLSRGAPRRPPHLKCSRRRHLEAFILVARHDSIAIDYPEYRPCIAITAEVLDEVRGGVEYGRVGEALQRFGTTRLDVLSTAIGACELWRARDRLRFVYGIRTHGLISAGSVQQEERVRANWTASSVAGATPRDRLDAACETIPERRDTRREIFSQAGPRPRHRY